MSVPLSHEQDGASRASTPDALEGRSLTPDPPHRTPDIDGGVALDRPRELRDVRRFSHEAMATVYEVYAVHRDPQYAAQAAQAAFDLVDRLERELSRFLPNSDITRINHLGPGERTRVTPSTLECLLIARHMFDLTGGAFDVSIGTGLPALAFDPDESTVRATAQGVRVDLGGIGKGYAVDLMAELLEEWDLEVALVHGGFSSVLALEPPPDLEGWPLTLSDPRTPSRVLERLSARQTALSASGLRKGDHILDPRTGAPVRGRLAAWVTLPRPRASASDRDADEPRAAAATVADALTTAFMLLDRDQVEAICRSSPGLEAWILEDAGLVHFAASARRL
ncbi:MAG: FAD:protein FMN transferase [Acidobacteria bacterium]|nr:FAD:protein FMN transferase [Acidobacteriota bacterium]